MAERFIVDAHLHVGRPGFFFAPESDPDDLLKIMDSLGIGHAVCMDHLSIFEGCGSGLEAHREMFERSKGRIHYLGVFHPERASACLATLDRARDWAGFAGIKLHPSIHRIPADDPSYEPVWAFADQYGLPMLTHSWSVSSYNPVQYFSTPDRFENYARRFRRARIPTSTLISPAIFSATGCWNSWWHPFRWRRSCSAQTFPGSIRVRTSYEFFYRKSNLRQRSRSFATTPFAFTN